MHEMVAGSAPDTHLDMPRAAESTSTRTVEDGLDSGAESGCEEDSSGNVRTVLAAHCVLIM